MSGWKSEFKDNHKKANKRVRKTMPKTEQTPCSVCLVYRRDKTPLIGRFSLDGSSLLVCDKCLNTILALRFEHPEETEGQQWNWEPIKTGLRMMRS